MRCTSLTVALLLGVLGAAGCPDRPRLPTRLDAGEQPVPTPQIDSAFLLRALGPGRVLANRPLLGDLDRRLGTEAVVATHRGGHDFQVAVVRGNHQVLAQAPLGGKILAHASIEAVGDFREMDLWGDGAKTLLMPVETWVYHHSVCGIVAFRYRRDALALIGEFSTKCWRKDAGGDGSDPFSYFKTAREAGELRVETDEPEGKRLYRWDEQQQAFLSVSKLPGK